MGFFPKTQRSSPVAIGITSRNFEGSSSVTLLQPSMPVGRRPSSSGTINRPNTARCSHQNCTLWLAASHPSVAWNGNGSSKDFVDRGLNANGNLSKDVDLLL